MKIKISKHIRKYIIIYLALLLGLFLLIEMVPRVTDAFETTEILEPGQLSYSCEAHGYLVKTETISVATESGTIKYLMEDGTVVRKNKKVAVMDDVDTEDPGGVSMGYKGIMDRLKGYDGVRLGLRTPISGVFSRTMDGCEMDLNPNQLDELTYEKVKSLSVSPKEMDHTKVSAGDPVYKVTSDDKWYVACWLDEEEAAHFGEGQEVRLVLPAGTVKATISSVLQDEKRIRIVFFSDRIYDELPTAREVDMTIQGLEQSGLLVHNECIIEKGGVPGVYVRDKNGDYYFMPVNVLTSDGSQSVISEASFYDPESGDTVFTVDVYDEVLKHPESALKKDLKEEQEEKEEQKQEPQVTEPVQETQATEPTDETEATEAAEETDETEKVRETQQAEQIQITKNKENKNKDKDNGKKNKTDKDKDKNKDKNKNKNDD